MFGTPVSGFLQILALSRQAQEAALAVALVEQQRAMDLALRERGRAIAALPRRKGRSTVPSIKPDGGTLF